MIKVDFTEPATPEWEAWKESAIKAVGKLISKASKGEKFKISELYKDPAFKQAVYKAFHGKCAYCERKFVLDQAGDIDHFRPKGAVTDENDKPVQVSLPDGKVSPHPGYYWLAYDWRNLLPTCSLCNRPTKLPDGKLVGKMTRFPVIGTHQWEPGKEGIEQPLFLHPVVDNPCDHLGIDTKTGIVFGKTDRGKACINLLGLNREGLPEERRRRYSDVERLITDALIALRQANPDKALSDLKEINAYERGEYEFAWAARERIREDSIFLKAILEAMPKH